MLSLLDLPQTHFLGSVSGPSRRKIHEIDASDSQDKQSDRRKNINIDDVAVP